MFSQCTRSVVRLMCNNGSRACFSLSSRKRTNIGFIGLGNMGAPMASNLIKAGHKLTVYDLNSDSVSKLASEGASAAESVGKATDNNDVVITMLPASAHVQEVYSGLLKENVKGKLFIDASTIDPSVSRQVNQQVSFAGALMVDAPVSGGVLGAVNGTLTFMVGGTDDAVAAATPILKAMGQNVVHVGGPGNGEVAKVCNNLVLAIHMTGVSEAMNLGIKLGLDAKVLASVFNSSTARCWSSDTYNPVPGVIDGVPSSRDYEGGFGSALMSKDVGLAINAAHDAKVPVPMGAAAHQLYNILCSSGLGSKDFSVIYKFWAEKGTK